MLFKNPRERTPGNEPLTSAIESSTFLDRIAPEVVGLTYWFDPPAQVLSQSITMRFTGRRLDRSGRPKDGDVFTIDETINGVVAGCGPVAVTIRIRDVNPGEWAVQASLISSQERKLPKGRRQQSVTGVFPASWSWRRWRVTAAPSVPVRTRRSPFIRPPAVLLGSWAALVAVGIVLALVAQALVISGENLKSDHVLTISILSVLSGVVGAKAWYVVLHRRDGSRDGWAVQGFVSGFALVTPLLLLIFRVPIGAFLDASTPGLMLGLAVGRLGCFFTGCCSGRPSASRWAIWSSNRKVGLRRVPTQLMESTLAVTLGAIVLAAILLFGPRHGTFFIAAVATYTLIRQGLLRLREESRQSSIGAPLIAIASAVILAADLAVTLLI